MRKSQQIRSRKRQSQLRRKQAGHRRIKRIWMAIVVRPLLAKRQNTRSNRLARITKMQWLNW